MNLSKKKKLAKKTFNVGEDRIVFLESRLDEIKEAIDHISPSAAPYSSIGLPYIMRPRANEDRQIVKMWLAVIENLLPQYTSDAAEDNEVNNMLLKLTNSSLDNLLGRGRTEILKKIKGEE